MGRKRHCSSSSSSKSCSSSSSSSSSSGCCGKDCKSCAKRAQCSSSSSSSITVFDKHYSDSTCCGNQKKVWKKKDSDKSDCGKEIILVSDSGSKNDCSDKIVTISEGNDGKHQGKHNGGKVYAAGDNRNDLDESSRKFDVRVVNKVGHPWQHRIVGTNDAFAVNGVKGKVLHLRRGQRYRFNISQSGTHPFYFTADPVGGRPGVWADSITYDPVKLEGTPDPVVNGTVELRVSSSLPNIFYYQCRTHGFMGGIILVH